MLQISSGLAITSQENPLARVAPVCLNWRQKNISVNSLVSTLFYTMNKTQFKRVETFSNFNGIYALFEPGF